MVSYNNGKIYKIEPISNGEEGDVYIGSTTKEYLSQRFASHKSDYNRWKNGKAGKISSYDIFDKYGFENCHMVLLELVNVNSIDEIRVREGYFIKSMPCVNKKVEGRSHILEQERRVKYERERRGGFP
jgi:hypothetical protein